MKKIISTLLVLAMVACMLPAFAVSTSAASANPQQGLNATFWHSVAEVEEGEPGHADAWRRAMAWHGKGHSNSYETNEWFDAIIDQLVKTSYEWPAIGDGTYTFGQGFHYTDYQAATKVNSGDSYMVKWEGSMKATTAGTYTFIGNGLDNGVAIFVDDKKAFEWWGPDSWFDKDDNTPLLSKYTFTITEDQVGKDIPFEMWFLEIFSDERLDMSVTMDGTAEGQKSMEEAGLTFALSATYYTCLLNGESDDLEQHMIPGDGKDAGNAANHTFSEDQLNAIKGEMLNVGTTVIADMESSTFFEKPVFEHYFGAHYNGFLIEYDGYLTPTVSGNYTFGTQKVDNCFLMQLEIDGTWKTVYEFWGAGIWNDTSTTYYDKSFDLTAGTSYKLRAIFLEIGGGEPLVTSYKIDGTEYSYSASGILLTTEAYEPGTAPITKSLFDLGSEWKYQMGSWTDGKAPEAPAGWPNSIADTMQTGTAPMHDEWTTSDNPSDGTQANAYLWLAKEFTVDDLKDYDGLSLMADIHYDDDVNLYINGTLVFDHDRWSDGTVRYKLAEKVSDLLVEGKNIVAVSLVQHWGGWDFNMGLCASNVNAANLFPMYTEIATADELNAYVALVNKFNAVYNNTTHPANVYLTADIDMTGKEWTPMDRFVGTFHGNNHTITGLTYINNETVGNKALLVKELSNLWDNAPIESGTILDLTLANGLLVAPKTEWNAVGALVGNMDRGTVKNCHVVDTTVIGGDWTGGIIGRSSGSSTIGSNDSPVENCSIKNSTVIAVNSPTTANKAVAAIVGTNDSGSKVILGDYVIENVVIMCDEGWTLKGTTIGAVDTTPGCEPSVGPNASEKNVTIVNTADADIRDEEKPSWSNTESAPVDITISATDNAITAVTVNGEVLPKSYYTIEETAENTVVVTLKESYLKTLETGEYTISVESYQGNVETTLSVTNDTPIYGNGDSTSWMLLVATLSLAGVVFATKKRRCTK